MLEKDEGDDSGKAEEEHRPSQPDEPSYQGSESKADVLEESEGDDNGKAKEEQRPSQPDETSVSPGKEATKWLDVCKRPERVFWLCGIFLIFGTQIVPVFNLVIFSRN